MGILGIPNELLLSIGEDLSIKDLSHLLLTCSRLSSLLAPRLYKLGVQDVGKLTALQWAAERGHSLLAEQAIARGAEIDKPNEMNRNRTPLHSAAMKNHSDVIRILIKHGASTSAKDSNSMAPLHHAVLRKNVEATKTLVELRADMTCTNASGETPAHLAARRENLGCMKAFVDAGFDFNTRGSRGRTILHNAAFGSIRTLEYLLGLEEGKMAINARNFFGATPLHLARYPKSIELLLRHGADMEVTNQRGDTPAHNAVNSGSVRCLKAFIEAGFDINARGYLGQTVLHRAVFKGKGMVRYLLRQEGGQTIINTQDSEGKTPLALAADSHIPGVKVGLLLQYGADPKMKDSCGITPAERIHWREQKILEELQLGLKRLRERPDIDWGHDLI